MTDTDEYRLSIDAFSPDTISMERLAAYMAAFARVLGEEDSVHYVSTEPGCVYLVAAVDTTGAPKVEDQMMRVRSGDAPEKARKALKVIDELMRLDNANGAITGPDKVVYVDFQGRGLPKPLAFGPFRERHSLDGTVVKIGGINDSIPVWLQDGERAPQICGTDVETSKRLAGHYRRGVIRVFGVGTWLRGGDGIWKMQKFKIENFEPLDDTPLAEVVGKLQAVGGSRWHEFDDPVGEVLRLRHGDE